MKRHWGDWPFRLTARQSPPLRRRGKVLGDCGPQPAVMRTSRSSRDLQKSVAFSPMASCSLSVRQRQPGALWDPKSGLLRGNLPRPARSAKVGLFFGGVRGGLDTEFRASSEAWIWTHEGIDIPESTVQRRAVTPTSEGSPCSVSCGEVLKRLGDPSCGHSGRVRRFQPVAPLGGGGRVRQEWGLEQVSLALSQAPALAPTDRGKRTNKHRSAAFR